MSNVNMRFGGVSLSHNPKTLKIIRSKNIASVNLSDGQNRFSHAAEGILKISGTGELYGENCFQTYEKLLRASCKNVPYVLSVPELGVFFAVLSDLSINAEPKSNFLSVAFTFRIVDGENNCEKIFPQRYYFPQANENLWDVSYKTGINIEKLTELNPDIKDIRELDIENGVRLY